MSWGKNFKEGEKSGFDVGVLTVTKAEFVVNDYGNTQLELNGTFVTREGEAFDDNVRRYGLGDKFDPIQDGRGACHESGDKDKAPHENSGFADLVRSTLDVFPALEGRGDSPLDASVWEGLTLEGEVTKRGTWKNDAGEVNDIKRFIPTKVWVSGQAEASATVAASNGGGSEEDRATVAAELAASVKSDGQDFTTLLAEASKKGFDITDPLLSEAWEKVSA